MSDGKNDRPAEATDYGLLTHCDHGIRMNESCDLCALISNTRVPPRDRPNEAQSQAEYAAYQQGYQAGWASGLRERARESAPHGALDALQIVQADRDEWKKRALKVEAILSRLGEWTHMFGKELVPGRADTYGEGVRDSKKRVADILGSPSSSDPKVKP